MTRARAFESAIACLHGKGYSGASTLVAAQHAGISRVALIKQFPTKASSMPRSLLEGIREEALAEIHRFPPGLPRAMARVDHICTLYKQPKAFAVLEVMFGARGDPELSKRLAQVGRSRQQIEKQLLGDDFEAVGIKDRRTAGLAMERQVNKQSASLDASFGLQRAQPEALLRSLMEQEF